jgi:hypothetical protein
MEKSQEILISAYRNAMEDKIGSDIEVSWKQKTGESVKTKVIVVPISYMGELLALHFISKSNLTFKDMNEITMQSLKEY